MRRILLVPLLNALLLYYPILAHAEFRKALDALDSRDGERMLAEVKEAAEEKDTDGLVLFIDSLYFDGTTIKVPKAQRVASSNEPQFISLLNQAKTKQLFDYLQKTAAGNSYAEFRLANKQYVKDPLSKKQQLEKLANEGSAYAALGLYLELLDQRNYEELAQERAYWLKKAADLGSPYAAYLISAQYLDNPVVDPIRLAKMFPADEQLGSQWTEKALLNSNPLADPFRDAAFQMADIYNHLEKAQNPEAPKQAFHLKMLGCFSPTPLNNASPQDCLAQTYSTLARYKDAELPQEAVTAYGSFWCDSGCDTHNQLIPKEWENKTQLELPAVLALRPLKHEPVFTLQKVLRKGPLSSFQYRLNFYEDGRVSLLRDPAVPDEESKETSWKLSRGEVTNFIQLLNEQGFGSWKLANYSLENSSDVTEIYSVRSRSMDTSKTVHFYLAPKDAAGTGSTLNRVLASVMKLVPLQEYAVPPSLNNKFSNSREHKITKNGELK